MLKSIPVRVIFEGDKESITELFQVAPIAEDTIIYKYKLYKVISRAHGLGDDVFMITVKHIRG